MGIDIDSYRCRIGTFVHHHGAGGMCMPFYFDFSVMIKVIGTASFVRLLLIMAGIEQNPGPADKFIFRYQYLLVKLGTDVLRKVFDVVVGNNVVKHLTAKSRDIQSLRAITADQKQFLPPIDNKPDSSNFDITLLSCLLRNICGRRHPNDPVWTNPASTDTSIEADITRLRTCRNQLMHSDKLLLPEADFNSKWQDLSAILNRLNKVGGVVQFQSYIDTAESMDIDERLREELDQTIKAWNKSDRLLMKEIEEVKSDVVGVKRKLEDVERTQEEMKRQHVVELTDIQKDLIEFYKRRCKTLPVSPLFENKDDTIMNIYKQPTMNSVEGTKQIKQITCYEDLFCKDSKSCNQIYITGDAGMGKTSFCTFMSLLWSVGKSEDKLDKEQEELQTDVEYMSKFDFVFYISLRDTEQYDVIDMIKEQYLKHYDPITIRDILRKKHCLILMDGLDEWTPKKDSKKMHKLPERIYSDNCVYLTTCRPYRMEQVRLSHTRDIDHKLELTGIHGKSALSFVKHVVSYMNKENSANRNATYFKFEVTDCGLGDQLCIPMIASHLVVLWFEKGTLTDMPKALIYANILEMLFKRSEQKEVEFPQPTSTACSLQLPDSLSGLECLNKHASLLYNACHLSFRSLFKQDENVPSLVFTRQQLLAKPYCISIEETDFLCKIGILSKDEVFGVFSVERLKISFIHKSYMEFLAALFISKFDTNFLLSDVINIWKSLRSVVQYQNFFLMLAGLSHDCVRSLFETMYSSISSDLSICRIKNIFHSDNSFDALQFIMVECYYEISRSNEANIELKLEDFIFGDYPSDILKRLFLMNIPNVKSIHATEGKYLVEFDQIKNLQCLHVGRVYSLDIYAMFTECMLRNQSTLHTVCIEGGLRRRLSIPALPVRSLQHLTSLSLSDVKMGHNSLNNLGEYLSRNRRMQNIKFHNVHCKTHQLDEVNCGMAILNLKRHKQLNSLYLYCTSIDCRNLNTSSLKYITLSPWHDTSTDAVYGSCNYDWINGCYVAVFNRIENSLLQQLNVNGEWYLDINAMKTLACAVKTLPCIKSLSLNAMQFPADVLLQLHPDVTQVKIQLDYVTISPQCFQCFIKSFVNNKSAIKVELDECSINSVVGETHIVVLGHQMPENSVEYMSDHLTSISTVNVTHKDDKQLHFETRGCQ